MIVIAREQSNRSNLYVFLTELEIAAVMLFPRNDEEEAKVIVK